MKKYLFENHIKKCKNQIFEFEKNIDNIKDYLRAETKKYLEESNNFFNSIDTNTYEDFDKFNKYIKALNDELNTRVKFSSDISPLVYVVENVDESDYYTYKEFISQFHYDEKLFKNANEYDLKFLKTLNRMIEKLPEDFEAYKERGDLKSKIGLYAEAVEDYEYAVKLNNDYNEAKKSLEELNKRLENKDFSNKNNEDNENNEEIKDNKELKKEKHKNIEIVKKQYNPKSKEALQNLLKNYERISLADINISLITDMSYLFSNIKRINFDGIETWDVSNVTHMSYMFYGASSFNQDISNWDISNIIWTGNNTNNMKDMFKDSGMKELPFWYIESK